MFHTWFPTLRFNFLVPGTFAVDGLRHASMRGLAEQGKDFLTNLGVKTHEIQYPEFFSQGNSWACGQHLLHFTQAVAQGFLSLGPHGGYTPPDKWDDFVANLTGLLANIGVGSESAPMAPIVEVEAQAAARVVSYHFVQASCRQSPPCCQPLFIASFVRARDIWAGRDFFISSVGHQVGISSLHPLCEPSVPLGTILCSRRRKRDSQRNAYLGKTSWR